MYVTWVADDQNADDVSYRVFSGATQLGSDTHVDQQETPQDPTSTSAAENIWRLLGTVAPLDGTLTVELDGSASVGRVVADGVLLMEHVEGQEIETVFYDALGQVKTSSNNKQEVTAFTYDTLGRTLTMTSPTGKTTRFVVDLLGRQTAVIDPEGNVTLGSVETRVRCADHNPFNWSPQRTLRIATAAEPPFTGSLRHDLAKYSCAS